MLVKMFGGAAALSSEVHKLSGKLAAFSVSVLVHHGAQVDIASVVRRTDFTGFLFRFVTSLVGHLQWVSFLFHLFRFQWSQV
jgi:hypothetical protein